jgi:hypothetical protein
MTDAQARLSTPHVPAAANDVRRHLANLATLQPSSATFDELETTEATCDALEKSLLELDRATAEAFEQTAVFAALGIPRLDARPWTPDTDVHAEEALTDSTAREMAETLALEVRRLGAQIPSTPIFFSKEPNVVRLFFRVEEGVFRIDVEVSRYEDAIGTRADLVGVAPPTHGPVRLRPQTFGDDLAGLVGFGDLRFDHEVFDSLYFVKGKPDDLHAIFRRPLRDALVALSRQDIPSLTIGDGRVQMTLGLQTLGAACRVLAIVRDARQE